MASASQLRRVGIVISSDGPDKVIMLNGLVIGYAYVDESGYWVFDACISGVETRTFDRYKQLTDSLMIVAKSLQTQKSYLP